MMPGNLCFAVTASGVIPPFEYFGDYVNLLFFFLKMKNIREKMPIPQIHTWSPMCL